MLLPVTALSLTLVDHQVRDIDCVDFLVVTAEDFDHQQTNATVMTATTEIGPLVYITYTNHGQISPICCL